MELILSEKSTDYLKKCIEGVFECEKDNIEIKRNNLGSYVGLKDNEKYFGYEYKASGNAWQANTITEFISVLDGKYYTEAYGKNVSDYFLKGNFEYSDDYLVYKNLRLDRNKNVLSYSDVLFYDGEKDSTYLEYKDRYEIDTEDNVKNQVLKIMEKCSKEKDMFNQDVRNKIICDYKLEPERLGSSANYYEYYPNISNTVRTFEKSLDWSDENHYGMYGLIEGIASYIYVASNIKKWYYNQEQYFNSKDTINEEIVKLNALLEGYYGVYLEGEENYKQELKMLKKKYNMG